MAFWAEFIGPAYRARSETIAADVCLNLFPEQTAIGEEGKRTTYYGTPGLKFFATVATQGDRGSFSQDGVTLTVVGAALYSVNTTAATTSSLGTIRDDGLPVSFASNGRGGEQVAIVGGGELKILDLLTMTLSGAIPLPLTNAPQVVRFIDGYFLLNEADTIRVWFSALEDGLNWDALDFFARSETSDNVIGIDVLRNRVWVFGSQTSEIFYDSGDADSPFVPYPGTVMQEGAVTPFGIVVLGESIFWLAQDNQGRNRMVMATDPAPTVISWPSISFALAQYTTTTDAEVLAYEQEGHPFVIWTFPTGNETWGYDVREQQWHKRDKWNQDTGISNRWRARGVCAPGNLLLVGDFETGDLYTLDMDTFEDNGAMIRRCRRAPYLSQENQWLFLDQFEMGIQSGVGLASGQGSDPKLMLQISRDHGVTWTPPVTASMGPMGRYLARPRWRQLGRVRADSLVVQVTQTDPVRAVWGPGAWLRATPGSGLL